MNGRIQELQSHVRDYLRGYGRNNLPGLERIAQFSRWSEMAEREITARAASLVTCFSDEELQAVCLGQLDMQALAREVIAELEPKP